jgi:AcrR family transcriptional regulator
VAPPKRISRETVLVKAKRAFAGGATPSMDEIAAAADVSRAALYGLFGSRGEIIDALGLEQPPSWQDRILETAAEMLAERGLNGLSFDELATRSGASRATVYRLFPGKAALFREIVRSYLPLEENVEILQAMRDRPPAEVMPALATSLARAGRVRIGVLRSALFEVTGNEDGSEEVLHEILEYSRVFSQYLEGQIAAGRLRRMHPLLALQLFVGSITLHLVSRPMAEASGLVDLSLEEVIREFTDAWLRATAPTRQPRPRGPASSEAPRPLRAT